MLARGTRLLSRRDVAELLQLEDCMAAVEAAFRDQAFACWVPARGATRIDPMVALRRE